jgi:hypothetical protein
MAIPSAPVTLWGMSESHEGHVCQNGWSRERQEDCSLCANHRG